MRKHRLRRFLRYCVSTGVTAGIVAVYFRRVPANETTVALTFLVAILLVAANWGLRHAVYLSIVSATALNFFFLPPVLTFSVRDGRNWIALLAFLITGIVASHLAEKARQQSEVSRDRQREAERLSEFSQQMLVTGNVVDLLKQMPEMIARTFNLPGAVVYVRDKDSTYRSGVDHTVLTTAELREASFGASPLQDVARGVTLVPINLGARPIGAVGVAGTDISIEAIEAVSGLAAIAIERANAVERLSKLEASRENERLRNALLDSVAHELRTPLTSIIAAITSLRTMPLLTAEMSAELMLVIEEEAVRLNELIGQAMEMAELDAHEVKLELKEHSIQEAVDLALESAQSHLRNHPIEMRLPPALPRTNMDLNRIGTVIQHLLENAAKYSEAGSPIVVSAEISNDKLVTNIADRGVGIEDQERAMIFDTFYRGQGQRFRVKGTGMGLAIAKAIMEAHQGSIYVTSQPGHGSVFSFSLPLN